MRKLILVSLLIGKSALALDYKDLESRFNQWATGPEQATAQVNADNDKYSVRLSTEQLKQAAGHLKWIGEYRQKLNDCTSDESAQMLGAFMDECLAPGFLAEGIKSAKQVDGQWEVTVSQSQMSACRTGISAYLATKRNKLNRVEGTDLANYSQDWAALERTDALMAFFGATSETKIDNKDVDAKAAAMLDKQHQVGVENFCLIPQPAASAVSETAGGSSSGGYGSEDAAHSGQYGADGKPYGATAEKGKPYGATPPARKPYAPTAQAQKYTPGKTYSPTSTYKPAYKPEYKAPEYAQSAPSYQQPSIPYMGGYKKSAPVIPPAAQAAPVVAAPAAATPVVRPGLGGFAFGLNIANRKNYPLPYPPPMPVPPPPPPPPPVVMPAPTPVPLPPPPPKRVVVTTSVTPQFIGPMPCGSMPGQMCSQSQALGQMGNGVLTNPGLTGTSVAPNVTNVLNGGTPTTGVNPYGTGTSVWGTSQQQGINVNSR
ncbi:hypothetical protein K2X33_02735 [bacterium]|nr:hypothetical protein [bacterium]